MIAYKTPKPVTVGVYIIVRDAEDTIRALLESIATPHERAGLPFDEYVIIDTGSQDRTKEIITDFFGQAEWDCAFSLPCTKNIANVILGSFAWCDDFSKARNYAFSLGTAEWRGYLDADDTFPKAANLRGTITFHAASDPRTNCIQLKYQYGDAFPQDVLRFVRWADGWHWQDEIHEHLVRDNGPRAIAKIDDLSVIHHQTGERSNRSILRNIRICSNVLSSTSDPRKRGLMYHYLGSYARELGDVTNAREMHSKAASLLPGTNIAAYSHTELAKLDLLDRDFQAAQDHAALAISAAPDLHDGHVTLGIVLAQRGAHQLAIYAFETEASPAREAFHDAVWLDGVAPCWCAMSMVALGRHDEAAEVLSKAAKYQGHAQVGPVFRRAYRTLMKAKGLKALQDLVNFSLWSNEPLRAQELLSAVPASLDGDMAIAQMKRSLDAKLPHTHNWQAYKDAYASIPEATYHTADEQKAVTLTYGRARAVIDWAKGLSPEGPPIRVLSIGAQDCIIEAAVLEACARIHVTVCDVAPQANAKLQALMSMFPHRVEVHSIVMGAFDWFPEQSNVHVGYPTNFGVLRFDAVFLFEVLEHLPEFPLDKSGPEVALKLIADHLTDDGTLFLSCPVSDRWIEPYLTDSATAPAFYGHLRSYSPERLWRQLRNAGLGSGDLIATDKGAIFLARVQKSNWSARYPGTATSTITILVPNGAPFNPESLHHGHLGGSEEAVVHLSHALARAQQNVIVYAPMDPDAETPIYVSKGVQWKPLTEFDPEAAHGSLLVWRAPDVAAELAKHNKVYNWLHDTHYGVKKPTYEKVAGTIVLSRAHAEILQKLDGCEVTMLASNGIDVDAFASLENVPRDPHRVIYASSPDRGLVHLLAMWSEVKNAVPEATLHIYYDWSMFRKKARQDEDAAALLATLERDLKQLGVVFHSGVSHDELHRAYAESSIWAYPTDFYEISCISAMKAQAAGCWPIYMTYGALPETCNFLGDAIPERYMSEFRDMLIRRLKDGIPITARKDMSVKARRQFSWDVAAQKFLKHLE